MTTITIDLSGSTFGNWKVLSRASNNKVGHPRWLCKCSCGSECVVDASALRGGRSKSCGCLKRQAATKHGMFDSAEYIAWQSMWQRCTNVNSKKYHLYKDRTPPDRWKDFDLFLADMGLRPSANHSIERINNDLPYSPENCKWATRHEQNRNKSTNRWIEFDGRRMILVDWANHLGMNPITLESRLRKWPVDKALTTPVRSR